MSNVTRLKLSVIIQISQGLNQLSGYEQVIEENNNKRIVKIPYKFAPNSNLSWNITKNKRILREYVQDYTDARDDLIKRISGGNEISEDDTEKIIEFNKEVKNLLEKEIEVSGLLKLKLSALNIEQNPIPSDVFDLLFELIEEDLNQPVKS